MLLLGSVLLFVGGCAMLAGPSWKPAEVPLMTQWAEDVSPGNAHPEYPRPQMTRKSWRNLNGLWEYAIRPIDELKPMDFDGHILVPFPVESALSGVMKMVGEDNRLWYRRTFAVPGKWKDKRVLLHFGAVDWETTVWVNGTRFDTHSGGYDPFSFDITEALTSEKRQEIVVSVWDPTDAGGQPRGKQVREPHAIWYTPTTGIWQTVWLEPVPQAYIESLTIVPDIDSDQVWVTAGCAGAAAGFEVEASANAEGLEEAKAQGRPDKAFSIPIDDPKLWSPGSPFLYDLEVTLKDRSGRPVDSVNSYFGMRKISLGKDQTDVTRILLNNKPLFQYGPLDQGFWPEGLYTAPTDEALRYDIEIMKQLGCNMLRKHVKIEPDRLYYWCDKLGLMVWQDMPNANNKSVADKKGFAKELQRMIDAFRNHPSIIVWVLFNEGWGQHDTEHLANWMKAYDPRRLVNNASGWDDKGVGDVHDNHKYPGPEAPKNEPDRAAVLGEFGGLGRPIQGHLWKQKGAWGHHGTVKTEQQMTDSYLALLEKLKPLIADGLCAAVYTQTSDVEIEVNGFMTYDRALIKMDAERITAANKSLYQQMP
jgi:beta-galactosidase/beta-glucuronidase